MVLICGCAGTKNEKIPVVSSNPDSLPVSYRIDGELKGASVDCIRIILPDVGYPKYTLESRGWTWSETLEKTKSGEIDILTAVFRNAEREKYFVFSDPYLRMPILVAVPKQSTLSFITWDDLKGKKGLVGTGESYGYDFDEYAKINLMLKELPLEEAFKTLADGKADYLVIEKNRGIMNAFMSGRQSDIKFLEVPVTVLEYRIAISRKSSCVEALGRINRKIRELDRNDIPGKMVSKHLSAWENKLYEKLGSVRDIQNNTITEKGDLP